MCYVAYTTSKGDAMDVIEGKNWVVGISVSFTDKDVRECMPHLKGVTTCVALESVEELLVSYVREAGCEILWQLLNDNGWNIGGKNFIEDGGW
jgi:hypothetical protein